MNVLNCLSVYYVVIVVYVDALFLDTPQKVPDTKHRSYFV